MAIQDTNGNSDKHRNNGPKVAIIGAGLTGLIAAQGLKKSGFNVVVFERDESIAARPRDWSILIGWGMSTLTELLPEQIVKNFPQGICNPHLEFNDWDESVIGYNGATGEVMFQNSTPGARRISRRRLRKVLAEGLDIRWGKYLDQMMPRSTSMDLIFRDGERYEADYVLGTDGVSSKVRELLMGAEKARPVPSGYSIANCVCKYGDADKVNAVVKAHSVCALMLGTANLAGCGVMSAEDPNDVASWETFWVKVWRGHSVSLNGQEAINYAKKDLSGICEPFRSALEWTPVGSSCYLDEMKYWLPSPWETHDGRVTLAGDAAHPMLPFRGQGLQHAIIDVQNYINTLSRLRDVREVTSRKNTMEAYGADVVERGSVAVAQSLKEAENSLNPDTVGNMLMVTQGHGRSI
ncbi:hypothetical protein CABS01_07042 [Colletotrichum abscissum]|uniref:FAD-binding domain-containing protein n=1 Tax=Colletotrichum abscissum TaxID=1671311 RepID=A0A9Q0B0X5_9PEZI|nr:uncharacterized protein CABS01_07042 [Colletotrichum abscissum]KAI3553110.1 hypothetical protein CABS02_06670 [Colletotrichum abscissum]KAK1513636.1 hypothetical protein CABS01_07042 [Colletotrichum abscissum]